MWRFTKFCFYFDPNIIFSQHLICVISTQPPIRNTIKLQLKIVGRILWIFEVILHLKFMNGILLRWTSKDINNVNSCLSLWHMSKVWPQTARLEIYFGKTSSCTEQGHANIWEAGSWNCTKTSIGEKEQNDITLFSIRALQ